MQPVAARVLARAHRALVTTFRLDGGDVAERCGRGAPRLRWWHAALDEFARAHLEVKADLIGDVALAMGEAEGSSHDGVSLRRHGEGAIDGAGMLDPARRLGAERASSGGGERVVLGVTPGFATSPLLSQQPATLEAMECGIEHALLDDKYVVRGLANPSADGVAVARAPADGFEDEEV